MVRKKKDILSENVLNLEEQVKAEDTPTAEDQIKVENVSEVEGQVNTEYGNYFSDLESQSFDPFIHDKQETFGKNFIRESYDVGDLFLINMRVLMNQFWVLPGSVYEVIETNDTKTESKLKRIRGVGPDHINLGRNQYFINKI